MTETAANRRPGDPLEKTVETRIARAVGRARAALVWEQIWPLIAPFLVLAALFAALSWFGLWRITSDAGALASSSLCSRSPSLASPGGALRFAWPSRAAAFARVEQATGALHRPATAFTDRLASRPDDPTAAGPVGGPSPAHAGLARPAASAGLPAPRLAARDPYALRFLVAPALRRRLRRGRPGAHRPPRRSLPRRREHGRGRSPASTPG